MGYVIDAILAATILIIAIVCFKKGFVKIAARVVGIVLAFVLATTLSGPIANFIYDGMFKNSISQSVDNTLSGFTDETIGPAVDKLFDSDSFSGAALKMCGVSADSVKEKTVGKSIQHLGDYIKTSVVRPAAIFIIKTVCMILLIILLLFLVKLLAKLLSKIFSFSVIGVANRILGLLAGIILGLAAAVFLCIIINFLMTAFPGFLGTGPSTKENSFLFGPLSNFINWSI